MKLSVKYTLLLLMASAVIVWAWKPYEQSPLTEKEIAVAAPVKYLYVAVPGIRNYLEYG